MTAHILVAGAGKIGTLIATLLAESGDFQITLIDKDFHIGDSRRLQNMPAITCKTLDISDKGALLKFCRATAYDAVISCLPFFCNKTVAEVAHQCELMYMDLTEDVANTNAVKELVKPPKNR